MVCDIIFQKWYNVRVYTESPYAELHIETIKKIVQHDCKSIFEIGCGNGVFAERLFNSLKVQYIGFDFSRKRVEIAQKRVPEYMFLTDDIYKTDLYHTCEYDTVVCHEVFEHLRNDLYPLRQIRKSTRIIFSVPTYDAEAHVRYFNMWGDVFFRYSRIVNINDYSLINGIFLVNGTIK